jgi:hypothetical protein
MTLVQVIIVSGHAKTENFHHLPPGGRRLPIPAAQVLHPVLEEVGFFDKPSLSTIAANALTVGFGPVMKESQYAKARISCRCNSFLILLPPGGLPRKAIVLKARSGPNRKIIP